MKSSKAASRRTWRLTMYCNYPIPRNPHSLGGQVEEYEQEYPALPYLCMYVSSSVGQPPLAKLKRAFWGKRNVALNEGGRPVSQVEREDQSTQCVYV